MPIALETRGLSKAFRAGSGLCVATTVVLRNIDLVLHSGDAVGLLGGGGSGKTTLLLCLAGLLGADAGFVEWFGDASVAAAARHVLYHSARTDLMRAGSADCAHIHLVDVPSFVGTPADLDEWIALRQLAGDAVIVAGRCRSAFPPDMPILSLTRGRLRRAGDDRARVAEEVRGS